MRYTKKEIDKLISDINKGYRAKWKGKIPTISVSKTIEYIKSKFDTEKQALACSERDADNPDGKYYNMSPEEIIAAWDKTSSDSKYYGSMLDDYVGHVLSISIAPTEDAKIRLIEELNEWILDNNLQDDNRFQENKKGFDQFYSDIQKLGYKYLTREIMVYIPINTVYQTKGRFDCLFYNEENDKYLLIDWKTTENISKKAFKNKKLKGPANVLEECTMNEYGIQLYLYKKAFCELYKFTTPDKIDTYICQCLRAPGTNGKNYVLHRPLFNYNSKLISDIQWFAGYKEFKKKPVLTAEDIAKYAIEFQEVLDKLERDAGNEK